MIEIFRIIDSHFTGEAFSGKGAEIAGGRFNSSGLRVVYTSGSLSLAMLELLVQVDDKHSLIGHIFVPAFIDRKHIEIIEEGDLPAGWDSLPFGSASQEFGDRWLAEQRSLILQIPSIVVPRESNFLINPLHSSFDKIEFGVPEAARFDVRLMD